MASPTPNKGYTYPVHGGSVNAWDTPLNADFDQIDLNVGGYYPITATTTTAAITFNTSYATVPSTATSITPNTSIAQNLTYRLSGSISSTMTMLFPEVGSHYIIDNQSTAGTLKVNTVGGTSAVTIAIGGSNLIYTSTVASNSVNIVGQFQAKLYTQLGTPTGSVSGTAGSANGSLTDTVWDTTNKQLYVCTTTGTTATAVWTAFLNRVVPEGYLTLSTDASNPIISSDYVSKTAVYYTPFQGNWAALSDGTAVYPYEFSQLSLSLSAGVQAANSIYDVFLYNSTAGPLIGTGPAWSNAGAGTGSRGSGAGTTQLSRLKGVWTNTVQVTLTNGSTSFTCPINQGVYLGSILIDGTAGQVTCHRSYGQSRNWGVWNNYNRQPLFLKGGDPTSSWALSTVTSSVRFTNASSQNNLKLLSGLSEEPFTATYYQSVRFPSNNDGTYTNGIGWNSSASFNGLTGIYACTVEGSNAINISANSVAKYATGPSLGLQQAFALEQVSSLSESTSFFLFGTEAGMLFTVEWRG